MNILELDSFNLGDAIKFHDRLNHRLWDNSEHLHPQVKEKLLEVAKDFQEFLGVSDLQVKDITISGSNAAYSYTDKSDIDLHLVVDIPDTKYDEVFRELFDAKKYQYNDQHNIKIGGSDVELYVQPSDQEHHSQGVYSLLRNSWLSVPKRRRAEINDSAVRDKVQDLSARIDSAVESGDYDHIANLQRKIKTMRQTGLEQNGEFGTDNIAFKLLRNQGYIKKLIDARNAARDQQLSLAEKNKQAAPVIYGFVTESPDGVNPSTKMFLEDEPTTEHIIDEFIYDTARYLGIENLPEIVLHTDPEWSEQQRSFGMYQPKTHTLHVSLTDRHLLDIMRTTAHELAHCRQHEIKNLGPNAGETGSDVENEAHAVAGIVMRNFADAHPEYFKQQSLGESSGYIPTEAEKNDPRFEMALSVDVRPGATGLNANRMSLKTDAQGKPQMLRADGKVNMTESRMPQPSQGQGKYRDLNEPLGPETPPQMPAGTTKIDVTDLTDWYRVGMDISDIENADPEDYNQGPPQTVITFPSDEMEQPYLKQFKRLGLKTHDMDPDVEGGEDTTGKHLRNKLAEEFELFEEQDLFEINMGSKSLRREAAKTGAIAGMEFEMIVPNTENDDGDLEADYDQDERVRDIDDAVNFFDDGDYNYGTAIRSLRESMQEDYQTWVMEAIDQDWYGGQGMEFFQEYLDREDPFDAEDAEMEARNELQTQYGDELDVEEFEKMLFALVDEKRQNYTQEQWDDQGRNFDRAREEFEEEQRDNYSEQDWLENQGIRYASDVESNYDVTWPYWDRAGGGEASIQDVAQEFENAIGRDTKASGNYHSGSVQRPSPTQQHYVVEPDGSLEADSSGDTGLEFVSPPLPIDELLSDLNKVKQWAGIYGCYTNDSTGLHINISVPDYSRENLDFVKLALLMGDEYVLDNFGRSGNTYAKSAMKLVKEKVRSNPDAAKQLLDKMKGNLDQLATKAIHSGITSKYTSINTKDGHIEFRSPGGDWLDENFDKIENTLLRFTVAMSAALNPDAYRQEYQKKLYKLLTADNKDTDTIKYFAQYAAGELPKAALRSFVKQAQLERKVKRGETGDQKMWWRVGRPGYGASAEVVASSKDEAIALGKKEYPDWANAQDMTATPLRPYEEKPQKQGTTVAGRPSNPEGNWYLKNSDTNEIFYRFNAANYADAYNVLQQWKQENPDSNINAMYGYGRDEPAQQDQGNWGIWIDANNRFANQPGSYARGETPPLMRFPSRAAAEQWLEQQRAERPNLRTDIEVREIAPRLLPGSTLDLQRQRAAQEPQDATPLRPTGPGPWELASRSNNQVYFNPEHTNRAAAETEARTWLQRMGLDPAEFEVRTRETASNRDAAQGGLIDVATDQPTQAPRTLTTPGQGQQVFTGQWKVVDNNGQELYQFGGVGNSQGDANRVAQQWVNAQRAQGNVIDAREVDVLPVMGPA